MIYGYARVSTAAQDLATQLAQLEAAGCERVYHDKLSGLTTERPQLKKLLATASTDDTVIIPAIDRLSRDTADLLTIARDLKAAGVGLRSLAEPILDTTSELADIVLAVLGLAAKLEHKRLRERTAAGRAKAKADGVKFGPKHKLTLHQQREAIRRRDVNGEPVASIARSFNVSRQTISRLHSKTGSA
ncbi:Site-specific DNA recombinase [Methylobacterium sp. UNC378MF]|uniref:recombinase family protein n=1 Tax=Methylobacterium sp. UNC378MF TaxID=1502748 RepID=UPI0008921B9E|nr:recombinase family protein [Methylobacterium sp. UNC378MF]SDA35178.1 Site-specific DNA recombinase [Methylobacterium sp. UNC378MF]